MNKVTKTADLSEYSDAQIELMFQSAKTVNVLKSIVKALKDKDFDRLITSYDPMRYPLSTSQQILGFIKMACANEKIDPKVFDI